MNMFKIAFLACLIVAVVLTGKTTSRAQASESRPIYKQPERLKLNGLGEPTAPDSDGYFAPLTESLYPIGWSEDGKFAYYVEPADEACGCYFGKVVIQDLKTDKILWEDDYTGEENIEETIESHWKSNQEVFSRKLNQYGILPQDDFKLEFPAFSYKGDVFTPKLRFRIKTEVEYTAKNGEFFFGSEGSLKLLMTTRNRGSKVIYKQTYHPAKGGRIEGAEISGVLVSPFGRQSAVVLVEEHRGYEGPPNITRIRIVGSDLVTRFR